MYNVYLLNQLENIMPRPMLLMQQNVLEEVHAKRKEGVPVSRLIKDYRMDITHPTLSRLIEYYELYKQANNEIKPIIFSSLFPDWLNGTTDILVKQPSEYLYRGRMPLGQWEYRDEIL